MVAGLKFLSKKSFHPKNASNQKSVWERQQEKDAEAKRIRERERQLQRERDDEELAKARGDAPRLGFMYAVPPGLDGGSVQQPGSTGAAAEELSAAPSSLATPTATHLTSEHSSVLTQRQPGDDEAAAAFRALLASSSATSQSHDPEVFPFGSSQHPDIKASFGTVLHGTTHDPYQAALEKGLKPSQQQQSALSALEKAVGRKAEAAVKGSLTLDEQIQRFPALAHAPRAKGISTSHVGVSFKPLGSQIRNVRCLACGIWGHSRGERECSVTGWNPFASTTFGSPGAANHATHARVESSAEESDRAATTIAVDESTTQASRKKRPLSRRKESSHSTSESGDSMSQSDDSSRDKKRRRRHRHNNKKSSKRARRHHQRRDSDSVDSDDSSSRRRHRRRKRRT